MGRWSTHFDVAVAFTVRGAKISIAQDPASDDIGHSVWDVSRAVARFLELDTTWRRDLGRHRRVVELGAGGVPPPRAPRGALHAVRGLLTQSPQSRAGGRAAGRVRQDAVSSASPLRFWAARSS